MTASYRQYPGRPHINSAIEKLINQFAQENRSWGYDRIVGALKNVGHTVSDQTDPHQLPARSPNLNALAERWVGSVKKEALSRLILFGRGALRKVLKEYGTHYHQERHQQGKGNELLMPLASTKAWGPNPFILRKDWVDC